MNRRKVVFKKIYEKLEKVLEGPQREYEQMRAGALLEEINQFQKGNIYCIAGRPGMGKTTLTKRIIKDEEYKEFIVFSLEMEKNKFLKGLEKCQNVTLYDDVDTIEEIERIVKSKKTDVVVIDYFQVVQNDGKDLYETHTMLSHRLKRLATETDTDIIIISQLNRALESRSNKRPILSDFHNCSYFSLLQESDVIMFLYDEHYYDQKQPHTKEVIIAKNRFGYCKSVFLSTEDDKKFW